MYRYVIIILLVVAALCGFADFCYSGEKKDIQGYMDITWGTEYSDMSAHLDYLGEGKLSPLNTAVAPYAAYITQDIGYGAISFIRVALFDGNKCLIGVKLQAKTTQNSRAVYEAVIDDLERRYGPSDVQMVTGSLAGFKDTVSWRRTSGNVTFTHTKTGNHSTFGILFTANRKEQS